MSHAEEDGKYCVENTHLVQGQVIGDHIKVYNTYQPPTPHQTDPHRERMLRRLGRSYKELLDQSLHGIAWMELGLSARSDMVSNVTNLLFRLPHGGERLLAPGTSIVNAYDEAEGELLILGTPGAGKSTLLLDLARRLVDRAGTDPTYPLPVILRLSSWARERPTLETWMIEQLSQTYDISRQLSERWVTDGRLLPLLDGLDEMEAAARSACIAAINAYHHTHLTPLVVCSRHTDYEVAATRQRLALQSTVIVQPLSEAQIEGYLNAAGPSFIGVRTALQQEHTLRELATTPLMLSVLLLTYRGAAASEIVQQGTELERQVWTDYVARQIAEKGNDTRYPSERTCSWLSWLAQQMRTHNQTIFYLEYLQPGWLPEVGQRAYIWLGVLIPGIVIGGLICPVIAFFLGFLALDIELNVVRYLHIGLLGGLVGGLFSITLGENVPSLNLQFLFASDASRLRKIHLGLSILVGLVYVLCNGWDSDLSGWLSIIERVVCDVCIFGGTIGLSCWLLMRIFLYGPLQQTQSLPSRRICREGVFNRLYNHDLRRRILLVAGILGAGNGLINGLEVGFPPTNEGFMGRLGSGLGYGLITGMWFGLTGLLVCLILQRQVRDIYLTERLRWTVGSLQRSMFALKHLKATVLLICFFTLIVGGGVGLGSWLNNEFNVRRGLSDGLSTGLCIGLSVGLSYWLLFGLFHSIAHEHVEDQDRQLPNQGIHRSFRICAIMGPIGAGITGGISILILWLSIVADKELDLPIRQFSDEWSAVWLSFLSGGAVICIFCGGLAVLRHFVLRFLLSQTSTFPWQAMPFLEDAKARTFLQRVGGGYSFMHRRLLDYFADLASREVPSE